MCDCDNTKNIPIYLEIFMIFILGGVLSLVLFAVVDDILMQKQVSDVSEYAALKDIEPKNPFERGK